MLSAHPVPIAGLLALTIAMGQAPVPAPAVTADTPSCSMSALPGLAMQYARAFRNHRQESAPELGRAAAAEAVLTTDFWNVAASILGLDAEPLRLLVDDITASGVGQPPPDALPCDGSVRARDAIAWSMGAAGYSAREIADVVNGHLSRADLDEALARLMAGQPRALVTAFLDSRWRDRAPAVAATASGPVGSDRLPITNWDAQVAVLARQHQVAPDLIRAVIAVESGWNPRAVSSAGAIGLMQLMPATAAVLGVDPWKPIENLEGGVAYLASLLRAYGQDVRLALIAYNAGPQHADRVRSGRAVAYRETRKYVDAVTARYPLP